jgi:hypothetical protein
MTGTWVFDEFIVCSGREGLLATLNNLTGFPGASTASLS